MKEINPAYVSLLIFDELEHNKYLEIRHLIDPIQKFVRFLADKPAGQPPRLSGPVHSPQPLANRSVNLLMQPAFSSSLPSPVHKPLKLKNRFISNSIRLSNSKY